MQGSWSTAAHRCLGPYNGADCFCESVNNRTHLADVFGALLGMCVIAGWGILLFEEAINGCSYEGEVGTECGVRLVCTGAACSSDYDCYLGFRV